VVRRPERVAGLVLVESSVRQLVLRPDEMREADGDRPDATRLDLETGAAELTGRPGRVAEAVESPDDSAARSDNFMLRS
jgi:hypothetical protein